MIKPLEPPDLHHVRAAVGWIELGNYNHANDELENVSPGMRGHPDVLEIRWMIYAKEKRWDACRDIAKAIIGLDLTRSWGWLHLAYSLRRVEPGEAGLEKATQILLEALKLFPELSVIPYNLACYSCQLGQLKEAKEWLGRAFKMNDAKQLKKMALDDRDLEKLWDEIGSI